MYLPSSENEEPRGNLCGKRGRGANARFNRSGDSVAIYWTWKHERLTRELTRGRLPYRRVFALLSGCTSPPLPSTLPLRAVHTFAFEVNTSIPEIGARVWDVLVWRYPDVLLYRKRGGEITTWTYPPHFTFVFLAYDHRLTPLQDEDPVEAFLLAAGERRLPRQGSSAPHLRLVR